MALWLLIAARPYRHEASFARATPARQPAPICRLVGKRVVRTDQDKIGGPSTLADYVPASRQRLRGVYTGWRQHRLDRHPGDGQRPAESRVDTAASQPQGDRADRAQATTNGSGSNQLDRAVGRSRDYGAGPAQPDRTPSALADRQGAIC